MTTPHQTENQAAENYNRAVRFLQEAQGMLPPLVEQPPTSTIQHLLEQVECARQAYVLALRENRFAQEAGQTVYSYGVDMRVCSTK